MTKNEMDARTGKTRFVYEARERSARTGGHLWHEHVVETDDGPLRQLVAVDGIPLTVEQSRAERDRLLQAISNPSELHKTKAEIDSDEAHTLDLLRNVPRAFILSPDGSEDGCTRYAFRPNPHFSPSSMEERVLQVLAGTLSVREPVDRLCKLDATVTSQVDFGLGLLGRIERGGTFLLVREPIGNSDWKSKQIEVHVRGRFLLFKSISKDQDVQRTDIHLLPAGLTLQQSERFLR